MVKQGLSIILPLYNEEKNIKTVFEDILSEIKDYAIDLEIILVNDGSKDKTGAIAGELAAKYSFVRLVTSQNNQGYGAAIRKGIANAEKEWTLIMDADGQLRIQDLKRFWDIKNTYDFLLGYRIKREDNLYRRWIGKMGTLCANLFLREDLRVKDINCGFKLFRTELLKKIPLISSGSIFYFEILYKLSKYKLKFSQLPVSHLKRRTGKATGGNIRTIIKIFIEVFTILSKR